MAYRPIHSTNDLPEKTRRVVEAMAENQRESHGEHPKLRQKSNTRHIRVEELIELELIARRNDGELYLIETPFVEEEAAFFAWIENSLPFIIADSAEKIIGWTVETGRTETIPTGSVYATTNLIIDGDLNIDGNLLLL